MLSEQKMKNIINRKSKEFNINPQRVGALYGMEQLIKKISNSEYKDYFVLKGGFLLSTKYGIDNRTTKDLDATVKNTNLSEEMVTDFCSFLETSNPSDTESFKVKKVKTIREKFDYDGYNIKLIYQNGRVKYPLDVDLTTGEDILSTVTNDKIPLIFENGEIQMKAYPIEQIIADKFYTMLAYGQIDDTNSRSKDLYDIHFLTKTNASNINLNDVNVAIDKLMNQRNTLIEKSEYSGIIESLEDSDNQKEFWKTFQYLNLTKLKIT